MELRISWRLLPELDTVIYWYDNNVEKELVFSETASTTFTELKDPFIFSEDFAGFKLYHQVPFGQLKGVQSFAVHFNEVVPKDDSF